MNGSQGQDAMLRLAKYTAYRQTGPGGPPLVRRLSEGLNTLWCRRKSDLDSLSRVHWTQGLCVQDEVRIVQG